MLEEEFPNITQQFEALLHHRQAVVELAQPVSGWYLRNQKRVLLAYVQQRINQQLQKRLFKFYLY